jgi:very-short-patch-repair endonuclease
MVGKNQTHRIKGTEEDSMTFINQIRIALTRLIHGEKVTDAVLSPDKWKHIRAMYEMMLPEILEAGRENKMRGIDPYFVDWTKLFTPIERVAWGSIRNYGIPMYPQFPACGVFIDFANPCERIGIELDGKDWHDAEKDVKRDRRLMEDGWTIFRITGSECYRRYKEPSELIDLESSRKYEEQVKWMLTTCDGVIASIYEVYFRDDRGKLYDIALQSLAAHSYLPVAGTRA